MDKRAYHLILFTPDGQRLNSWDFRPNEVPIQFDDLRRLGSDITVAICNHRANMPASDTDI